MKPELVPSTHRIATPNPSMGTRWCLRDFRDEISGKVVFRSISSKQQFGVLSLPTPSLQISKVQI